MEKLKKRAREGARMGERERGDERAIIRREDRATRERRKRTVLLEKKESTAIVLTHRERESKGDRVRRW
jgi:hypothetical protein